MRIIAGIHRHRTLRGPEDGDFTTRPMLDRVKQAVFDRLWALGYFPEASEEGYITPEGNVLDLFSGVGQLGLEALSRGSAHCLFVEKDRRHRQLLEENLAMLELDDQATVLGVDILGGAWLNMLGTKKLRVVFCDPPYAMAAEEESMAKLCRWLTELSVRGGVEIGGMMVFRTPEGVALPKIEGWNEAEVREFGKMQVGFMRKEDR